MTRCIAPAVRRPRPPQASQRRGAALVELAVILPVLVLIFFATIEACGMINLEQSLKVAAYEATRVALVPGTTAGNVTAAGNQVLDDRRVKSGTVTVTPSDIAGAPYGAYIRVTVSAPAKGNSIVGGWFFGGKTLSSSVEMMKEY